MPNASNLNGGNKNSAAAKANSRYKRVAVRNSPRHSSRPTNMKMMNTACRNQKWLIGTQNDNNASITPTSLFTPGPTACNTENGMPTQNSGTINRRTLPLKNAEKSF